MKFEDVLEIKNGRNQRAVENPEGKYPIYGSGGVMGYANDYICDAQTVIIGRKGSINNPLFVEEPFWNVDTAFGLSANRDVLLPQYLYYFCKKFDFERLNKAVTIPSLTKSDLLKIEIDLPDLEKQQDVVEQLVKIEQIITLCKQELESLDDLIKARFVELFGDPIENPFRWDIIELGNIFKVRSSKRVYRSEQMLVGVPFLRVSDLVNRIVSQVCTANLHISEELYEELKNSGLVPKSGDVLVTSRGTLGMCYVVTDMDKFYFQDGMISWLDNCEGRAVPMFISYVFQTERVQRQVRNKSAGSAVEYLSLGNLQKIDVPLPPLKHQNQFADFVHQTDKSKVAVQKALDEAQLLFDSLMQKYFG